MMNHQNPRTLEEIKADEARIAAQRQLTVAALIEKLMTLPRDVPVWLDGCDCVGEAVEVTYLTDDHLGGDFVLIHRSDRTEHTEKDDEL